MKIKEIFNNLPKIPKIPRINIYFKLLIILTFVLMLCYFIIFFNIEKIIQSHTFPGVGKQAEINIPSSLEIEEINIEGPNGNNINGIYVGNGEGKTVYYFHGNGLPLPNYYNEIEYIHSLGVNVIAYDYPGYGKSTGVPTEENITQYTEVFYKELQKTKQIKDEDLIIWGGSIGTAIASNFAQNNNFDKIILISPVASSYDMATEMFGFVIQKLFFIKNTFTTATTVKYFSQPALIVHGNNDIIIPFSQGQMVYNNLGTENNAGNQKYFIELDAFGHNGVISQYGSALEGKLLEFLEYGKIAGDTNILKITSENKTEWEEKSRKYKNIFKADLDTDNSITKFVTSRLPFNNKGYIPENLTSFASQYIADGKGYGQLREEVIPHLNELGKAFYEEFGRKFLINSSYRSYAYQQKIKAGGCPDNLCAKAGYSEHQSGLGFDIFAIESDAYWKNNATLMKYYNWLKIHAHKYGFTNTYQKGLKIDGYEIEPWHWRYVGVDLATYLSEHEITIAEFYYQQKKSDE